MLVARDLKRKYAVSHLGYAWTLLEPGLMIGIYYLIFGKVAKLGINHYVLFIATAMVPWLWFRSAANSATSTLRKNSKLVTSISLPREIYPLEMVLAKSVEFVIMLPIVIGVAAAYHTKPTHYAYFIPFVIVLEFVLNIGVALMLSALTTLFSDIARGLHVALRLLFYLTPVIYPTARVHGTLRSFFQINPLVGIVELHRAVWFPHTIITWQMVLVSVGGSIFMFVAGWAVFIRAEPSVLKEL
jgi:ABC-2 type transport system permease protein